MNVEVQLCPYARMYELSTKNWSLLWGNRVVVLPKVRSSKLKMLHEANPGVARKKVFASGYVWGPGIYEEI